jgi:hypothetical protein
MDKRELIFENFKNIQDLIKFIDQKASALLVLYGFLLTAFIEFSKTLKFVNLSTINDTTQMFFSLLTLLVGLILVLLITYQFYIIIVLILKPRNAKHYLKNQFSLFYYEHISKMEKEELINRFKEVEEEKLTEDLIEQVFEVSRILDQKTINYAKATSYLLLTGVLLLFFILLSNIV